MNEFFVTDNLGVTLQREAIAGDNESFVETENKLSQSLKDTECFYCCLINEVHLNYDIDGKNSMMILLKALLIRIILVSIILELILKRSVAL